MAKKMLNPNTTLWAIPAEDVTDIKAITPTLVNGEDALNFSCAVVRGYNINPAASSTDATASICDTGEVQNRLYDTYEGEFTAFRDGDISDADSIFNKTFEWFKAPDKAFWIIRRLGKANTAPLAAGDEIEAFLFTNDNIRSIDGGDDGPVQFTVPLFAQGNMTGYFSVVGP